MKCRRITRALGAAAGVLLGAAFLPVAVAFADDYDIVADPNSPEVITGLYGFDFGLQTTPQAVSGSVDGDQLFDVDDTTLGTTSNPDTVGTFEADESTSSDAFGDTNQELLVTSDVSGTSGTAAGDTPPVGSVFDFYTFGDGSFENIYSDLPSPSGNVITDTLVTPFGDIDIPTTFDATAEIHDANIATIPVGDGYDIAVDPGHGELTGVNGLPPIDVAFEGDEEFDVDNTAGTSVGTFDGDVTTTADAFGNTTQTILVTSDGTTGTVGTAAGDVPAVGSEIDTVTFGGTGIELIYSDLVSSTGNVTTETLVTSLGDITIPTTYDSAAALATDILSAG